GVDRHRAVQRVARPHRGERVAKNGVLRSRATDAARRSRRMDTRFLRRMGAELHVLCGQWSQLDREILRDVREFVSGDRGAHASNLSDITSLVPAESTTHKSEVVAAQQHQPAGKRTFDGAGLYVT